jgi:DNA-binding NarL/FixJ family response regulator
MLQTIPVLVIEDNRLLREGIAAIVNGQPDLKVVALAETCKAAVASARESQPRVVLMDAALEDDSRICVKNVKKAVPEARVIMMDLMPVNEDIMEFVKAGASGFIVKDATIEEVVTAVRAVAAGKEVLPPALTGTLFSHIARQAVERPSAEALRASRMTPREREVIDLIAEGLSNKEIAHRLNLTTHTVKSHVHNILEKLALHSRLEVAAHAHHAADSADIAD